MEKLFIYGYLLDENIQKNVIGRVCKGEFGLVDNHILLRDWAVDGVACPRIFPHSVGCVTGQIIEVTQEELKKIDAFETNAYKRDLIHVKNKGQFQTYFPNLNLGKD